MGKEIARDARILAQLSKVPTERPKPGTEIDWRLAIVRPNNERVHKVQTQEG